MEWLGNVPDNQFIENKAYFEGQQRDKDDEEMTEEEARLQDLEEEERF